MTENSEKNVFAASSADKTALSDKALLEEGDRLTPRFDEKGLLPVVVTDAASGAPLMLAYMNAEALNLTLQTGIAHYYSRSRSAIWKKGERSGHHQDVVHIRIDCDQDALWMAVHQHGPGCCHVGHKSCFYRQVTHDDNGQTGLVTLGEKTYAPDDVYGSGRLA